MTVLLFLCIILTIAIIVTSIYLVKNKQAEEKNTLAYTDLLKKH